MENELIEQIKENLKAPKSVQTDSGKVEQHSISDQIKAFNFIRQEQSSQENESVLKRVGFYRKINLD